MSSNFVSKKDKKLNENKEILQKQKDSQDKYAEGFIQYQGKKIMDKKDNKSNEDIERAIYLFTEAICSASSSVQSNDKGAAKFHAARGHALMQLGNFLKASHDFTTAIRLDDQNASYYASKGNCKLQLDQVSDALLEFHRAISIEPNNGNYLLNRALVYAKLDKFQEAIDDYTKAIENFQENKNLSDNTWLYKGHLHRGNCYRQIKKLDLAIKDLSVACDLKKEDPIAFNSLGLAYFDGQFYELAHEKLSKACELDQTKGLYFNNLALALYYLGQHTEALVYFQFQSSYNQAIALDPNDANIYFNRANVHISLKNNQQALADLDMALDLDPNYQYYHNKGLAYQDQNDFENAIKMYEKALELNQDHIPSQYHLALMQHKSGMHQEAIKQFSLILEKKGDDRIVYESRGLVYKQLNQFEMAIQDFNKASEIEPNYPVFKQIQDLYYYRGLCKISLGNYSDSIEDFLIAQSKGCLTAGVFSGIGQAHRLQKNYKQALYYLDCAHEKEPNNADFYIQRSQIYTDIQRYDYSIRDLTQALEKKESDPKILYLRGLAYYQNNLFKEAIKDLYNSLQNQPEKSYEYNIYYHLGLSFASLDMFEHAIEPFSKVIQEKPGEPIYVHERAKCYLVFKEFQKALDDFNMVLSIQVNNQNAYLGRGFTYKALKQYQLAANDFEKAKDLDPLNPKLCLNYLKIHGVHYIKLCEPGQEQR